MAYKVSFGNYQHSGSLQATVDITGSTTVSGAVGNFGTLNAANISSTNITASSNMSASTANFGTLTVGSFNPSSISTTSLSATTGSFTTVAGGFVDALSQNTLPYWNDAAGQFADSFVSINPVSGTTIISGSGGLMTHGTLSVVGGAISSSVGVSSSVGQFGALTVQSLTPSTISTTTLTVTGITTLSGNVFLGDAAADVVTVNGQITGSLFAINGGAINDTPIGATTQRGGRFTSLSASLTLDVVGTSTLQALNAQATTATTLSASSTLQVGGAATIGNGVIVSAGGMNVTGGVQLLNGLVVNGNLTVNGPTITLGDNSADVITVNGQITGSLFAINGGAINGTTIGATTQSSANFTTISSSGDVIVGGNLTVQGTTTTVNSTTLEITDKNIVIASGSTTSLLANGSGLTLGSTGYQFNFQSSSAGTSTDFWQVSGSTGLTDFKAKTVFATVDGNVTQQATNLGDANGTLSLGINYSQADFTGPHTWTLPASPSVGHSVKVKAPHNCNGTNTLTVTAAAGAIDFAGNTSVVLASPDAAMELVYVDSANNLWKIF